MAAPAPKFHTSNLPARVARRSFRLATWLAAPRRREGVLRVEALFSLRPHKLFRAVLTLEHLVVRSDPVLCFVQSHVWSFTKSGRRAVSRGCTRGAFALGPKRPALSGVNDTRKPSRRCPPATARGPELWMGSTALSSRCGALFESVRLQPAPLLRRNPSLLGGLRVEHSP